ncbi:glycosyltransferase [Candidatus Parcubacteria bacterium]|nr:glycosyltransferase [Candidatus Parcubacteria bacterium]
MKISILNANLSNNCLGRTYLLAKILQRNYEVEIIGPMFGSKIWQPVIWDKSITYKSIKIRGSLKSKGLLRSYFQTTRLINMIDGDVIYANKNLFTSFGIGLFTKIIKNKPLVLDIDDWQMGFVKNNIRNQSKSEFYKYLIDSAKRLYRVDSFWSNLVSEKLSYLVKDKTVSNSFLKEKFGGTIIVHGKDTDFFNPENFDMKKTREKYGIGNDKKVIMFSGSPRAHKGLEDLVDVIAKINNNNIILFVVGIDNNDIYCKNLINYAERKIKKSFKWVNMQAFEKIPEFINMADLIVILQKKNIATIGQLPAKIFDAMAMAKPIIATNVNDMAEILDGCGIIVENCDSDQLEKSINYIIKNSKEAKEMGIRAREKCIAKYSWDIMEKELLKVFDKYDKSIHS